MSGDSDRWDGGMGLVYHGALFYSSERNSGNGYGSVEVIFKLFHESSIIHHLRAPVRWSTWLSIYMRDAST